jgi:hypothetical protein
MLSTINPETRGLTVTKGERVSKRSPRHGGGAGESWSAQAARFFREFWSDPVYWPRLLLAAALIMFALVYLVVTGQS